MLQGSRPTSIIVDDLMDSIMVFDPLAPEQLSLLDHHDKTLKLESLINQEPMIISVDPARDHFKDALLYSVKTFYGSKILDPKYIGYFESNWLKTPEPLTIQLKLPLHIKPTFKESMQVHKKFYLNKMKRVFRG